MGELDSYDWWWNVALDGVVGSVLAALVAVLVLVVTFRRESKHSQEARFVEHATRARDAIGELRALAIQSEQVASGHAFITLVNSGRTINEFVQVARRIDPFFGELADTWNGQVLRYTVGAIERDHRRNENGIDDKQRLIDALGNFESTITNRVTDRSAYKRLKREQKQVLLGVARQRDDDPIDRSPDSMPMQ